MIQHHLADFPIMPGVRITDTAGTKPVTHEREEIDQRANAVAAGLISLGLPKNSKIAIIGTGSYDYVTTSIGIHRSRHARVAINYKSPPDLIAYYFQDSGAALAFCDREFQHLVPEGVRSIAFGTPEFDQFLNYSDVAIPELSEDFVYSIRYTAGTTGRPKGVIATYGTRLWQLKRHIKPVRSGLSVIVNSSPLHHAGLTQIEVDIFCPAVEDTHIVIMPTFDARRFIKIIEQYRVTHVNIVSSMMNMILQETDLLDSSDLGSVKSIILTASAASKKLQDDSKTYFKNADTVINIYSSTELGGTIFNAHPLGIPTPESSVGFPAPGIQTRLDQDGVLQVKSPGMTIGYHNSLDLSKKSMTDDGFFITGDIFKIGKHGFYYWLGRADDMFKSSGQKIYPGEIETIIERHPSVAMSAVVGVPDPIKEHKPYAFVKLKPGQVATGQDIKDFVIPQVAAYQIPREVWIIDDLPRTDVGKIDRKVLSGLAERNLRSGSHHDL